MKNLFFIITAFALGMVSAIGPSAKANNITPTTVVVEKAGTLSTLLSQESMDTITSLILKGEINGDDVQVLRYMAGRDKDGEVSNGMLSELDMSEVQIKSEGTYKYDDCGNHAGILTDGEIPQFMFYQCWSLKKIVLPNQCTGIAAYAFHDCQYLEEVKIPEGCKSIDDGAFMNTKRLQFIVLPTTLVSIGVQTFCRCDGLQTIVSLNTNAPIVYTSSFDEAHVENITLYVPASSVDTYLSKKWKVIQKIEAFPTEPLMMLNKQASAFITSSQRSNTISLSARILTEDGMYEGVINWQSSNTDVATVNEAGEVTAKAEGEATITASITYKGRVYSTACNLQAIDITLRPNAYLVKAGRLKNIIPEEEKYNITALNLYGEINGDDVAFIRDMAGIDSNQKATEGNLEILDLTNVRVVEGGKYTTSYYKETPSPVICHVDAETSTDKFGEAPFSCCTTLKEVYLPATLKAIPIACFKRCSNIQKVQIPNSITEIGELAFYDQLVPGELIGSIPPTIFGGTMVIDSLTVPSHLESIGQKAFFDVGAVRLPDTIPAQLDKENPAILDESGCVIVPAKALDAYRNAEGWKTFYQQIIPDDAILEAEVTAEAREGGSGLLAALGEKRAAWTRKLTIHGTINSWDILFIRNKMPILCELDLSDARIVASPQEYWTGCHTEADRLGANTFRDLKKLREVRLPKILKYIGVSAFENCVRLRNIEIPRGVNTIDDRAFYSCTGLKNVKSPEGLMSIGTSAFEGSTVETINFPGSLRAIGEKAFCECYCLKEVVLPYAVRRIEPLTFMNCKKLQSVILPTQLNVIEEKAFEGCDKLTELHIPPMVESIGDEAFTACNNIKDLYVYIANANDISIDMNTFSCWNTATLHVPSFGYSLYYWNTQWSQFYRMENFDEEYKSFYTKNALVLNNETGKIDGTPDAIIYENGGLVVNEDVKQNIDNIEMKSDGGGNSATVIPEKETSIQAKHAQITVNVTSNQWHFFCFPFDIPLDSIQYQGDYVWRQYDGAARSRREGGWQNLPANETTLHAGRGYIFQGTNSGELKMAVDNPEFSANDVKTGLEVHPSEKAADASWNFVGNPYTSYYNIDSLAYEAPITVWTGNGYEAYRPGDDDYSFAPYTAFFVQTPEENQELGFGAGGRQTKEGAEQQVQEAKARRARRAANPARTLINLTIAHTDAEEDSYIDRTRIVFNEQKSTGYEASCDAAKFFSAERAVEIFTTDGEGNKYAINERPVADGKVALGISCHKAGTYRLTALSMGNSLYLQDAKTGEMHSLEEPCELMLDKGETTARFMILTEGAATSVKEIHAEAGKTGDAYDLSGRHVNAQTHKGVMVSKGTKVLK